MRFPDMLTWTGRWAAVGAVVVAGALAPWTGGPEAEVRAEPVVVAAGVEALNAGFPTRSDGPPPQPAPEPDVEAEEVLEVVRGEATFYADYFEGRTTASGVPFRQNGMTVAHRTYPFGTLLRVTNLRNDRSVEVRVTDRGPFGPRAKARGTIVDLSRRAARDLDFIRAGRAPVRVEVLAWGDGAAASLAP